MLPSNPFRPFNAPRDAGEAVVADAALDDEPPTPYPLAHPNGQLARSSAVDGAANHFPVTPFPAPIGSSRSLSPLPMRMPVHTTSLGPRGALREDLEQYVGHASAGPGLCHYKACKKVAKLDESTEVICTNEKCKNAIHPECSVQLVLSFSPSDEFEAHVCGKRCYNALLKSIQQSSSVTTTKKRVMWHNDGIVPSISSLSCILDWLTSEGNYSRYRGGDGQHGETKLAVANEIVRFIDECGVPTVRTPKDVMSKIAALEGSFKTATDWLANTGQGVQDEASLKKAIDTRCPYYDQLYPIMRDRPSMQPLLLNTDARMAVSSDEDDDEETDEDGEFEGDNDQDQGPAVQASDPNERQAKEDQGRETQETEKTKKRPSSRPLSIVKRQTKSQKVDATAVHPSFIQLKEAQLQHARDIDRQKHECMKLKVSLQRKDIELRERECNARIEEVSANANKLRLEGEQLAIQNKAAILRERQSLREIGVPQDEIDSQLPL